MMGENKLNRILIIKLGALGDVIRTTTVLKPLKKRFPDSWISWITQENAFPFFNGNRYVDSVLTLEQARLALSGAEFDLVLSLDDELEACEFAECYRATCTRFVGGHVNDQGQPTYTDTAARWFGMGILRSDEDGGIVEANRIKAANQQTYQTHLFAMAGLEDVNPVQYPPQIDIPPEAQAAVDRRLESTGLGRRPIVGLNTSSGMRWRSKQLDEGPTADLAERLINELNVDVVLLGGAQEEHRNRAIAASISPHRGQAVSLTTADLIEFAAIVSRLSLVITSDSLALHVATAVEVPLLAFFGPTSPTEIELYGLGEKITPSTMCNCFYKKECMNPPSCVNRLDLEAFVSKARSWLQ
jgi:heptosyltransferase-2